MRVSILMKTVLTYDEAFLEKKELIKIRKARGDEFFMDDVNDGNEFLQVTQIT